MLERIKQISWVQWIVMVVLSIAFSILIGFGLSYIDNLYYLSPWTSADQVSTQIAIDNFAGKATGDTVYFRQRMAALAGILLFLVVGPGLLILSGYESSSKSEKDESKEHTGLWRFKAGIVLTLMGLFPFTLEAIIPPIMHENTKISASRNAKLDNLRNNLLKLANESYEYLVLPKSYGGGDGSFEELQLQDLSSYEDITIGSYSIEETKSDTVLRIIGRAKPDYPVNDEDLEEVEVSVDIRPSKISDINTLKE
jgi:amino acid transporter